MARKYLTNINVNNNDLQNVDSLTMNTSTTDTPATGKILWDTDFETIQVGLNSSVNLQIGQEHVVRVKNSSGTTAIPAGKAVMFAGALGDTVSVTPAISSNISTYPSDYFVGITTQEIPADGFGFVTQFGFVNNLNTNGWTVGTLLYVDPVTAGALTSTRPAAPAWQTPIAAVTKQNASAGRMLVRAIPGISLAHIEGVEISSPADNEVLAYDSASGTWINQTAPEAGLIDTSSTAQTKTGNFTSSGDIAAGGVLKSTQASLHEGGQIELATAPSGTLSGTNVTIDVYDNKVRFFESGGTNRGFYIDISAGGATVGTNLAAGGSSYTAPTLAGTTLSSGGTIDTLSGTLTADKFAASNNGAGTNFKVGDDAWIGDINLGNTIRITGIQDATQGYLVFGNSDGTALGRTGTGALTYGGNTVWHSGNDGTGSGLDADTLDGSHASAFATVAGTLAQFAATTSSQLAGVISDETGSGSLVFATSPTISSPTISGLYLSDSSIVFEGATADAFETTLTVTDPTADRTITLPDASGTVALLSVANAFTGANTFTSTTGQTFLYSSSTQDGIILLGRNGGTSSRRLTLTPVTNLSGNVTINIPVTAGTLALTSDIPSLTGYAQLSGATFTGNIAINNGTSTALTTTGTTAALFDSGATTLNIGSAATTISMGTTSGTITIKNPTLVGTQTTQNLYNTVATTVNAFGAATAINIASGIASAGTVAFGTAANAITLTTATATVTNSGNMTISTGNAPGGPTYSSGNLTITTGTGGAGTGGNIIIDTGSSSTQGTISIGNANTTKVTIGGRSGASISLRSPLTASDGTAGTAPLYLTSGTNLSSVAAGAMEYNGSNLFFTGNTTSGRGLVQNKYIQIVNDSSGAGASYTTSQQDIFNNVTPALVSINLEATTIYYYKAVYHVDITAWSSNFAIRIENAPVNAFTNARQLVQSWYQSTSSGTSSTIYLRQFTGNGASGTGITTTANITAIGTVTIIMEGLIETNLATKMTPRISMSSAGTGPGTPNTFKVLDYSFIEITKLGSSTDTVISGGWIV